MMREKSLSNNLESWENWLIFVRKGILGKLNIADQKLRVVGPKLSTNEKNGFPHGLIVDLVCIICIVCIIRKLYESMWIVLQQLLQQHLLSSSSSTERSVFRSQNSSPSARECMCESVVSVRLSVCVPAGAATLWRAGSSKKQTRRHTYKLVFPEALSWSLNWS